MEKDNKTPLEGLFRGIASILQMVNTAAERAGDDGSSPLEVHRSSSIGVPGGLNAVYGTSLRVGPRVAPPRRRPFTVRQNAQKQPVMDETREPMTDLFDEGDHYVIVAELPGVDEVAVHWALRDATTVVIHAESPERKYFKEIDLPDAVGTEKVSYSYANGVVELRLWKL